MRRIKIVADSSCDIFELAGVELSIAPLKIITDKKEFKDTPDMNVADMVEYFDTYKGKSKSSCPNTGDWLAAFGDADDVFCVTITGGLSGSYNTACAAKQICEAENEGKRVFVLNSLSAGPEITLVMEKLRDLILEGLPFEEITEAIQAYLQKTGLGFMLKSLKTFAQNGRVSPIVAKLVGIAGICIVGRASAEGTLEPLHKCRGERRSLETLCEDLETAGLKPDGRILIGHCENESAALHLRDLILAKHRDAHVRIHPLRGLCSFYAEKGGVLVGFEKA